MAKLHTIGLHEPTAVQYLISEGLLSHEPDPSEYRWTHQLSLDEHGNTVQEEILVVDHCVVWSRGKIVKRVFNLDIEDELILHAFATSFPTTSVVPHENPSHGTGSRRCDLKEPALVVILKTQAHVFCFSGGVHVIPLPFVAARAFPFSQGCVLQPQGPADSARSLPGTGVLSTASDSNAPFSTMAWTNLLNTRDPLENDGNPPHRRPPTYCITDLLADIGLVAASHSRKSQTDTDAFLPIDEEILYMSTDSHLINMLNEKNAEVCVAVTLNRSRSTFTIWAVLRNSTTSDSVERFPDVSVYRKRQSTHMHDRPRAASGMMPTETSRESLGGLIQSFTEHPPHSSEARLSNIEHLAAELHDEFEPGGVQTRSSRRISSMLARSDLAPPTERSAFNDNVRGVTSRKSLSKSLRREGSFGSVTDRNSFGGRRSFPVTSSVMSNATSLLDPSERISFGEAVISSTPGIHELATHTGRMKKDLTFCKLKSFTSHATTAQNASSGTKVLVITHPRSYNGEVVPNPQLSVCIQEREPQIMTVVTIAIKQASQKVHLVRNEVARPELKAVQVQKGTNIADACLVRDGFYSRLVILSKTSQSDDVLHLEAPWSPSFRLNLPQQYIIRSKSLSMCKSTEARTLADGLHRVVSCREVEISHFLTTYNLDSIIFCDTKGRHHELSIELRPRSKLGKDVVRISGFALPAQHQDSLLVAFWEVRRWLDTQEVQDNLENIAVAIMLFAMAVPFISTFQEKPLAPNRKKKSVNLRSTSGSLIDATKWSSMQIDEVSGGSPAWTQNGAWAWVGARLNPVVVPKSPSKHFRAASLDHDDGYANKIFLTQCTDLTRDFLQSPAGENMSGTEGYLPCAINQDRNTRRTALASVVVALFLLLQEYKLEPCADESITNDRTVLTILIAQSSLWLRWFRWKDSALAQYEAGGTTKDSLQLDQSEIDMLDVPPEPFEPVSIFEYVNASIHSTPAKFHMLVDLLQSTEDFLENDPILAESIRLLPKSSAIVHFFGGKFHHINADTVSAIPDAILLACESKFRATPKKHGIHGIAPAYSRGHVSKHFKHEHWKVIHPNTPQHANRRPSHFGLRDTHALGNQALEAENLSRWDVSSEADRQMVTKLIFHQDRRFQEASRLVNQTRAPEVEFEIQPDWTEANALEAQKQLAQYATRRTFAVATGRGMMHFNARTPLLTEMVPVPRFSLQCTMRSKNDTEDGQPMTFSADRSQFTEEKVYWAFFHNGASAGLMISKGAEFIDTSWILYNKPPELTNRHAGLLLALGLNGHLKNLAKWVAFKYLTPKHTMTSVGLLLGLAASYKGTADTLTTRLLSVHITCLLPPGAAELNLSPLTQMTGIMGIGLVYYNTEHRRMSEVMLSEIECQDVEEKLGDEPILRNEGYRLIAGMSLGLINIGHGAHLHSLHDMRLVERLLAIAVGTKNINLVHVLDRATAGAVLALAFIFMKTNDTSIARKVDIPDTLHQFEYVRPDIFLLRTLARHLIMWQRIKPTIDFVQESLPQLLRHRTDLQCIKRLVTNDLPFFHVIAGICFAISLRYSGSQRSDARDLLLNYLDQFIRLSHLPAHNYDAKVTLNGIRNCLDILALSCATVMAGSGDIEVFRRLRALHGRTDRDTPYGSHLAAHMAIGSLFLSGGTATFGVSNLAIASLVIAFYPLFPSEILDNRGHLQALRHLWVLAVEHRCLIVRDSETCQIVGNVDATVTFIDGTRTKTRTPGLLPDLDTIKAISVAAEGYWPVEVDLEKSDPEASATRLNSKLQSSTVRDKFKSSSTGVHITIRPRPIYDNPDSDPFDSELRALDIGRGLPHPTQATTQSLSDSKDPLDWVFTLSAFDGLDHAERALMLSESGLSSPDVLRFSGKLLQTTPIDTRLEIEMNTLGPASPAIPAVMRKGMRSDKLWLVKILLSCADRAEIEDETIGQAQDLNDGHRTDEHEKTSSTRLRREVIERLRWRVWKICSGQENGETEELDENGEQGVDVL